MSDASVDFASLLCSRLCHDVLSPISALGNGLEMLADEDDPAMRAQCLALVEDGARAAADRLTFFRLAFGAAGALGGDVPADEVKRAIEGLVRANPRIAMGWMVDQAALPKHAAKVLLNLALLAIDALVRGGRIDLAAEGGEVVVRATGGRLVLDAVIREVLAGGGDEGAIDARSSPAWLVRRLAAAHGGRVELADQETGVLVLAAVFPR